MNKGRRVEGDRGKREKGWMTRKRKKEDAAKKAELRAKNGKERHSNGREGERERGREEPEGCAES